jgi:hypothetical protein
MRAVLLLALVLGACGDDEPVEFSLDEIEGDYLIDYDPGSLVLPRDVVLVAHTLFCERGVMFVGETAFACGEPQDVGTLRLHQDICGGNACAERVAAGGVLEYDGQRFSGTVTVRYKDGRPDTRTRMTLAPW